MGYKERIYKKELEDLSPSTHNMEVPHVSRQEYQFLYEDDGFMYLMTSDGSEKNDVKLPDNEIGAQIKKYENDGTEAVVTIISAMGEEACVSVKEAPKGNN